MRADIHREARDNPLAADTLVQVLESNPNASDDAKRGAIHKLVSLWPEDRQGLARWLKWLREDTESQPEPIRSLCYLQLAIAAAKSGILSRARFMRKQAAELDELKKHVPPAGHGTLDQIFDQVSDAFELAELQQTS